MPSLWSISTWVGCGGLCESPPQPGPHSTYRSRCFASAPRRGAVRARAPHPTRPRRVWASSRFSIVYQGPCPAVRSSSSKRPSAARREASWTFFRSAHPSGSNWGVRWYESTTRRSISRSRSSGAYSAFSEGSENWSTKRSGRTSHGSSWLPSYRSHRFPRTAGRSSLTTNTRARWPATSFCAGRRPGSTRPAIWRMS